MKINEVIKSLPASNAAVKNTASSEPKNGWFPAYSASGQDVWLPEYRYDKKGIVVSAVGARCGKAFKADGKWNICANTHPLIVEESKALRDYCWYMINDENWWIKGGTAQPFVKVKDSFNREHHFPTLKEQKVIVDQLDTARLLIEQKELQLKQLDSLIKARFVEMFGAPGTNPKGWNEIKLGEVCDLQNGYAFKSSDYIDKSSVLNCRMSNIRPDGGFNAEYHPKYLPEEYWNKCSGYRLFDGDVIIAMTDMASDPKILGVPTIVSTNGKKFLLNQRVGKLSFLHDDRINRVYLMHSLGQKYVRKELAKSAAGSTQINVGKPAILNIDIYEPPRFLQDQFATFVAQVDKSKFAVYSALSYLRKIMKI